MRKEVNFMPDKTEAASFVYDAFISYRHCEPDKSVAEKLHRNLEAFRIPKGIPDLKTRRFKKVFRDREELPTSSDLNSSILNALEQTQNLVIVCSSNTPASKWVNREIEHFISMDKTRNIVILLLEGTREKSIPEPLLRVLNGDSLQDLSVNIIDIRENARKKIFKSLKKEIPVIAALLEGIDTGTMLEWHHRRAIKRWIVTGSCIFAFLLSFTIFSYLDLTFVRKELKVSTARIYTAFNISNTINQLIPQSLADYPEANDIILSILEEDIASMKKLNDIDHLSGTKEAIQYLAKYRLEKDYLLVGDKSFDAGKDAAALEAYDECLAMDRSCYAQIPDLDKNFFQDKTKQMFRMEYIRRVSDAYIRKGTVQCRLNNEKKAVEEFEKGIGVLLGKTDDLGGDTYNEADAREVIRDSYLQIASVLNQWYYNESSKKYYLLGIEAEKSLLGKANQVEEQAGLSNIYLQLGYVLLSLRDIDEAEKYFTMSLDIRSAIEEKNQPSDNYNDLAGAWTALGDTALNRGDLGKADGCYNKSDGIYSSMSSEERQNNNTEYSRLYLQQKESLCAFLSGDAEKAFSFSDTGFDENLPLLIQAEAHGNHALTATSKGDFSGALQHYLKSIGLYEELIQYDSSMRFYLADTYNSSSIAAIYNSDPSSAVDYCMKALDIYQDRKNANAVYVNLAVAYLFDGQFENAMQIIDQKGDIAINELIITGFRPLQYSFKSTVKEDIKAELEQLKNNNIWCEDAERALRRFF